MVAVLPGVLDTRARFLRLHQKVVLTSGENGYGIPELQAVLNAAVAAENEEAE